MSSSSDLATSIIKFSAQTNGRDKLFRLVQYMCKCIWYNCHNKHDLVDKLKKIESSMSITRKLLRFGKSLDFVQGALKTIHIKDGVVRYTVTLSKISQAIFLIFDHIIYFHNIGVINTDKTKWSNVSAEFWVLSLILNLVRNLYDISNIIVQEREAQKKLQKSSEYGNGEPHHVRGAPSSQGGAQLVWKCVTENKPVFLDLLKNLSDLVLPLNTLGKVHASPGTQGVLGVISSAVGVATVWNPLLKLVPS